MQNNQQQIFLDGNTSSERRRDICASLLFWHGSSVVPKLATSIHILVALYLIIYNPEIKTESLDTAFARTKQPIR